ncbi:hypothetical protein [Chromobacterium sp. IIBBL 290-4]|uniref:hypothetical protein n=1 Tax=Chromobacterium sp. IIBBL 290-4 TaxID=2953890 RepID=UPI0020B73C39|nr:hypothetical protein [Chromobacterium sp. IIBBL 290-4]UTH75727.1 hypothetical protein NKT35_06410 [Chromobacterium sp. IIBBL 290-4]
MHKIFIPLLSALALAGCAAHSTSTMSSASLHGEVAIYDQQHVTRQALPHTRAYDNTSLSRYEFKASGEGKPALYGVLPLQINTANMVSGVLLFPPALLAARGVYAFYDFDLDRGVVRYREREADAWAEYLPPAAAAR